MMNSIVIGGGAAGLMASVQSLAHGGTVTLIDKNKFLGKKLLITGKGRCNMTNICEHDDFIKNIKGNGRFLNSAFRQFSNYDLMEFFNTAGLETKIERGGRVFPVSDKAADVRNVLEKLIRNARGRIILNKTVQKIITDDLKVCGVELSDGEKIFADKIVLATGGASYPTTGSDGSAYKLVEDLGHHIIELRPSLVPLESSSPYLRELQGLSLRNVEAKLVVNKKVVGKEFGEMLFAHFGLTGPIILSLSNLAAQYLSDKNNLVEITVDLKPALNVEVLDNRLQRDFLEQTRKQIVNGIKNLLPSSLQPVILAEAKINPGKIINQISKTERMSLVHVLKNLSFPITKTRPIAEAIITAGGIDTKEINPKTMESKLVKGLYFAGETIDVDGFTGGFNLQIAFSTGYVAGKSIAEN